MGGQRAALILLLILCFSVVSISEIRIVKAEDTIYIRADGSVEGTDKIQRTGNIYSFTDTIDGSIVVERDNVVVDGAGYTIDASSSFAGLTLKPAIPLYGEYISNVTIRNVVIVKGDRGILMQSTNNSIIANNTISNVGTGIMVDIYGTGNIIAGNNLTNISGNGIWVWTSNNTILANYITNSGSGIYFSDWAGNTVTGNHIEDNQMGINCWAGNPIPAGLVNLIYCNNFINNTINLLSQAIFKFNSTELLYPALVNVWDNGTLGNYWSNYNGSDANSDGIIDTPFNLYGNNTDNYPLAYPIIFFDAGVWEWNQYYVNCISNSTLSDFYFNPLEGALLRFNATGEDGTVGFCRVTVPKGLLNSQNSWNVLINEIAVTPTITEDSYNTYIYFTYNHSTKTVEIIGTTAIPENNLTLFGFLFLGIILLVIKLAFKKVK